MRGVTLTRHRGLLLLLAWLLTACDGGETVDAPAPAVQAPAAEQAAEPEPTLVGDAAAGKALAAQCAKCHGLDGVLAHSGAPFIAGLEQDYLIRSLLAYAEGARKHDAMQAIADTLGPEKLADVSAYYAQLRTPWHGAARGVKSKHALQDQQAIAAGAKIAARCNSCHGPAGNPVRSDVIPSLAGMSMEYFVPALKSYFSGDRQHGVMKIFKQSTDDTDIANLAAYYATRTAKQAPHSGKGDAGAGKAAATACAGCHGYAGNSLNPYMPNLAGQPLDYLIKAIKDYRDGRRKEDLMQAPVARLSDKTITNLAAYYALQTPQSPLAENVAGDAGFDPVADGAKIAASCNGCHGENGNSRKPGVPSLTGLHEKYLVAAIKAYQTGSRRHALMQKLVSHLSDTDIEKVGFYYAIQEPAPAAASPQGDPGAGVAVSCACGACHGTGGVSSDPKTPSLAGQDADYLAAAIRAYATGARNVEAMQSPTEKLSGQSILDVAAYYATQTPNKPETFLPETPAFLIKERCDRCHGERGFSTAPGKPRLAGQVESYLVVAMQEYQNGSRTNHAMQAMADVLSLLEIKAVAAYYARQTEDEKAAGSLK